MADDVRACFAVLALSIGLAASARAQTEAPRAPTTMVWFAPADAPAAVHSARDALAERARRAGVAFVDRSPSPPPPPKAPGLVRRGIDAYDGLRPAEALAALDEAALEVAETGADGLEPAELSDLFLYRALTHTQRGDSERAWDDLVRAATLDPARSLDPARFPTRAVEAFERARDAVRARPRAKLGVTTPAGCRVSLDGAPFSAATVEVVPGDHYLRALCPGYVAWGARIAVGPDGAEVTPTLVADGPPRDDELVATARRQGAGLLVIAEVALAPPSPPILALRRVDLGSGRTVADTRVALDAGGAATADALAAWQRLVAGPVPIDGPPPPRTRWYRSPWFWGLAGAAISAAILVPIVLAQDGGGAAGATLDLGRPW
jgi:hypothetical protein